jgi:uncharacterized membrane protein
MSVSTAKIKLIAKSILKENYISGAIATVIAFSAILLCSNIAAVLGFVFGEVVAVGINSLMWFFVLTPLLFGITRYFWRMCCGVKDNLVCIFYYYSSFQLYFKALQLAFGLFIRVFGCFLIFSIPVVIAKLISGSWLYSVLGVAIPIWTVNFANIINFLIYIAVILTVFSALKFYLAPMILVANEDLTVPQIIRFSAVISNKTYFDYLFFAFSFIGWILLSVLVIPVIFTIPYFIIAYLVYASYAVSSYNEKIFKNNQGNIPTYVAGV